MIRGEKIFTDRVRSQLVKRCQRRALELRRDAVHAEKGAEAIARAKSNADLERVAQSPAARVVDLSHSDFRVYFDDVRETCSYCGRKANGGCGMSLLGNNRFGCWRKACQREMNKEITKDKKQHPERWKKRKRFDRYGSNRIVRPSRRRR